MFELIRGEIENDAEVQHAFKTLIYEIGCAKETLGHERTVVLLRVAAEDLEAGKTYPFMKEWEEYWEEDNRRSGACPVCKKSDGYLNVGRSQYLFCDAHKVYWYIGKATGSSYRYETDEKHSRNAKLLKQYREITKDEIYFPPKPTTGAPESL